MSSEYKCKMCGCVEVDIRWKEHKRTYTDNGPISDNECMICKCTRCEYNWKEPTLVQKNKESRHE